MRIALLKGQSQYGSLRLHVDQLAAALAGLGHDVSTLDLTAEDRVLQLNAMLGGRPDAVLAFSGVGADLKILAQSAYDALGAVYASIYVDHPLHHAARLAAPAARKAAFFLDSDHVMFAEASGLTRGARRIGFLPPGANELQQPPDLSDEAFARRDIPVMFTGTYRGQPPTSWRSWPDGPARSLVEKVAERMAADARLPILEAFRASVRALGAELTAQLFWDCLPLLVAAQAFAEAYHRDALLRVLGEAEAPLQIWGAGWEPLAARYRSFAYQGVGSFAETLARLRRARIVLNINNGFTGGGHERVFTAMAGGAAVFSDRNPYYQTAFAEGGEIVTYSWPRMSQAPGQLHAMASNVDALARIARAGAQRVQAEHRWTNRAVQLVQEIEAAR